MPGAWTRRSRLAVTFPLVATATVAVTAIPWAASTSTTIHAGTFNELPNIQNPMQMSNKIQYPMQMPNKHPSNTQCKCQTKSNTQCTTTCEHAATQRTSKCSNIKCWIPLPLLDTHEFFSHAQMREWKMPAGRFQIHNATCSNQCSK